MLSLLSHFSSSSRNLIILFSSSRLDIRVSNFAYLRSPLLFLHKSSKCFLLSSEIVFVFLTWFKMVSIISFSFDLFDSTSSSEFETFLLVLFNFSLIFGTLFSWDSDLLWFVFSTYLGVYNLLVTSLIFFLFSFLLDVATLLLLLFKILLFSSICLFDLFYNLSDICLINSFLSCGSIPSYFSNLELMGGMSVDSFKRGDLFLLKSRSKCLLSFGSFIYLWLGLRFM